MTNGPTLHAVDPVSRALVTSDRVHLHERGARLEVDGRLYGLTRHAISRLQERATEEALDLCPHLDPGLYHHAIALALALLEEAERGWHRKCSRGRVPSLRSCGMIFVLAREPGDSYESIVTTYEQRRAWWPDEEARA